MTEKRATILDVARAAGVSIATVSRVLNRKNKVLPATERKVWAAAEALRFSPNACARGIRLGRSGVIGCVVPSLADHYFGRLTESVLSEAQAAGLRVFLQTSSNSPENEEACFRRVAEMELDGLLLSPLGQLPEDIFQTGQLSHLPCVVMQRRRVAPGAPHVYHDDEKSGYTAAKYLLRLGRRHIAFFAGMWKAAANGKPPLHMLASPFRGAYSAFDRLAGHIRALDEEGLAFDEALYHVAGFDFEGGYRAAQRLLASLKDFDAIICANDSVAGGAISALQEQGISIPHRVSVIGYDDSVFAAVARPTITSIHQDPVLMGRHAIEMIAARIGGQAVADRAIETQLIVRNSTAVLQKKAADAKKEHP